MSDIILNNMSLVLLLPLWFFIIIMCGRFFSVYVNDKVIYLLTLLGSLLGVLVCSASLREISDSVEWTLPFVQIKDFIILYGLHIDRISLIIALVLFLVSFFVQLYSISYLKNEKKKYRFFALLNLFNFSMAFLLFSPNLFQFYVFWELVSVVSYLLVGFEYDKVIKTQAAKRMFIINRVGDTALLAAIIMSSYVVYGYSTQRFLTTLPIQDIDKVAPILQAYTTEPAFWVICICFIVSAAVKSAQFPFHTWLQDAMEAKIPVSALLHSATMVVAGVYLLIRILPLLGVQFVMLKIISTIGFVSALLCSIFAILENHPKKVLAYSTSASLGLMFAAVGMTNVMPAIIFLVTHAFIKSMMFLLLPNNDEINYPNLIMLIIGGLSLCGLILSGFYSKEILYRAFLNTSYLPIILVIIAIFSAIYVSKFILLVYKCNKISKNLDWIQSISCFGILVLNILLYWHLRKEPVNINMLCYASIFGIIITLLFNKFVSIEKINLETKPLENVYNKYLPEVYIKTSEGLNYIEKNWGYVYKMFIVVAKFGVFLMSWIEANIMMKTVEYTTKISQTISIRDKFFQTGKIQAYNAYGFIFVTIIITMVIIGYMFLIGQFS